MASGYSGGSPVAPPTWSGNFGSFVGNLYNPQR